QSRTSSSRPAAGRKASRDRTTRRRPPRCAAGTGARIPDGSRRHADVEHRRAALAVRGDALHHLWSAEREELETQRRVEDRALLPVPLVQRILGPAQRALRALAELLSDLA